MNRRIEHKWRLREIMAARGLNNISDLLPLLTDRGITLSDSQIYRLVGQKPERMSLALLGAITDALECSVEDLCHFEAVSSKSRLRRTVGSTAEPISLNETIRPRRARIRPTDR
ncbi:helix-turn-helix transcriptional regulator [Arthrobacter sp. BL-252-APC-1A]|uniref:helix-turn-helix domain-containing protein n=1 Tax=Arthrobacter sp. BL-252-APC-1A TaxID=2606622 RepID=UPI0012B3B386|nr:helix-turn-helix transcriptional regulator [Arthrobacter sp. BL-252-APC-1A]MSR97634.1 helix-turn-helix transcriptional regulator [Arthrobacter sp. BL-252-APC-1A]